MIHHTILSLRTMTSFIDTHCHMDMLKLDLADALQLAHEAGVSHVITIATNEESIRYVEKTVPNHPAIFGTVGVHPHDAQDFSDPLDALIREVSTAHDDVVAIGEIGLDYHYLYSEKDVQKKVFQHQLELAEELKLPVVLHTREAEEDTLAIMEETPVSQKGVAHSFTSSLAMAKRILDLGWYIGINGISTFKSAESVREVARAVPIDRLLLETDAPFLSPIPFRGKPNNPSRIPVIAEFIAKERNMEVEALMEHTTANALRLFNLNLKSL